MNKLIVAALATVLGLALPSITEAGYYNTPRHGGHHWQGYGHGYRYNPYQFYYTYPQVYYYPYWYPTVRPGFQPWKYYGRRKGW